jgi:hypothetical protein
MTVLRRHYETHVLGYDLVLALVFSAIVIVVIEQLWGRSQVIQTLNGTHQGIYGALASIAGSLLGFSITTVLIVMGFIQVPQLQILRESRHHQTLYAVFFSTIKYLALAVALPLVALLMDRATAPFIWVCYVVLAITAVATMRLYRSMWALEKVIQLAIVHRP